MKTILAILSITLLIACDTDLNVENRNSCQDVQFDTSFEMKVGESACLPDGRSIRLLEAKDEFCPCDAVCVWEGQLSIKLETEDLNQNEEEIIVGSTKNIPHGNAFEDVAISDFTYIYNGVDDSLPLCDEVYNENEIVIILTLSQ